MDGPNLMTTKLFFLPWFCLNLTIKSTHSTNIAFYYSNKNVKKSLLNNFTKKNISRIRKYGLQTKKYIQNSKYYNLNELEE